MLTDDDLTGELKLAFDDATHDLAPAAGLGAAVHRRHRAARRRSVVMRIAVPAAAACAGGVVVVGTGSSPSSNAPTTRVPTASGAGPQHVTSRPTQQTVAYLLKVPAQPAASFPCLDPSVTQAAHGTATWLAARDGCTIIVVDTDTTLPADVSPIDIAGVPGIYGSTDNKAGTRTIYSRNASRAGWSALTVAADTPDALLQDFYTPSG